MAKKTITAPAWAVNTIQLLADKVVGQAAALKAKFDLNSSDVKTYVDAFIVELQDETLGNSGSNTIGHNSTSVTADNVGDALEENRLRTETLLPFPDGSVTGVKLADDIVKFIDIVDGADNTVLFQSEMDAANDGDRFILPKDLSFEISSPVTINKGVMIDFNNCHVTSSVGVFEHTFSVSGVESSLFNVTVNILEGQNTITLGIPDVQTMENGDYLKIISDKNYYVEPGRDHKRGEIVQIKDVNKSTGVITTFEEIVLEYLTADSPTVQILGMVENILFENLILEGDASNSNQVGINLRDTLNAKIVNCEFTVFDVAIGINRSVDGSIYNCWFHDIILSGAYGVIVGGSARNIYIHHNKFNNTGHGITTGDNDGVCMWLDFSRNIVTNSIAAGLNCHGNVRYVNISDNILSNCVYGISNYGPYTAIKNNKIHSAVNYGILCTEAGSFNFVCEGNEIYDTAGDGVHIRTTVGADPADFEVNKFIVVKDNIISDLAGNGVYIHTDTLIPKLVVIKANTIKNHQYTGCIVVAGAEQVNVSDNVIYDNLTRQDIYTIDVTGVTGLLYDSTVYVANNHLSYVRRGIKVNDTDRLFLDSNMLNLYVNDAFNYLFANIGAYYGGEIMVSPNGTRYKLAVSDVGAITAVVV